MEKNKKYQDQDFIRAIREGDEKLLRILFRRYQPKAYGKIKRKGVAHQDVADVYQEGSILFLAYVRSTQVEISSLQATFNHNIDYALGHFFRKKEKFDKQDQKKESQEELLKPLSPEEKRVKKKETPRLVLTQAQIDKAIHFIERLPHPKDLLWQLKVMDGYSYKEIIQDYPKVFNPNQGTEKQVVSKLTSLMNRIRKDLKRFIGLS